MAPRLTQSAQNIIAKLADMPEVQALAAPPAIPMGQHGYITLASTIDGLATALGMIDGDQTKGRIIAAETLRACGANGQGIDAAMHALFGIDGYDPMTSLLGA